MPTEIIMPKVDMDMDTGTIMSWYVDAGKKVTKGEPLFAIETDKAAMDIDAPDTGILQHPVPEGTTVEIGQAVAWLYAEDEVVGEPPGTAPDQPAASLDDTESESRTAQDGGASEPDQPDSESEPEPATDGDDGGNKGRTVRATPKARMLAREGGIDLEGLVGSGPAGRIQAEDIPQPSPIEKSGIFTAYDSATTPLRVTTSVGGSGHPYVMVHGFASDATAWATLEAQLDARPVHRIELPGHGKSPMIRITAFSQLLDSVLRAFDKLALRHVHLVGHSLGAALCLALADARPDAIDALTLIAPAGLGPDVNGNVLSGICKASRAESLKPWLQQLVFDESIITDSYVRLALSTRTNPGLKAVQAQMADVLFADGVQTFDLRESLSRLTQPTQIIWGKQDAIIPWKHALRAPGQVALHLFSDTGHLPQIEQASDVAAIIRRSAV